MSLGTCLTDLRATGQISDVMFDKLNPIYEELIEQYRPRFGEAAEARATRDVLDRADLDLMHRKRQALLTVKAQSSWLMDMRRAAGDGKPFDKTVAEEVLVRMDGHRRAIRQQALQLNTDLLARHRRNLLGEVREKSDLQDVLAEVWGRDTGNLNAREMADSWRQTGEWLRSRFNAAGGRIAKLDRWNLPQTHSMRQVRDAGFEDWRNFLIPLLDRQRMLDFDTGQAMSDAKLELMLRGMYEAIATDGWSRNNPGGQGIGAMANRRADHRVLHFAEPEGWSAYAEKFGGGGTAFDAMLGHIEGMARDIAAMETMGPNPAATLGWQKDWMRKSAADAGLKGKVADKALDRAEAAAGSLGRMFDEYTGANNRPERRRLAMGFSIFRSQQTAAKLGGAMLSVGGDYGLMVQTARFNGLSGTKALARYTGLLNPANSADRAQAARTVLMADQWADGHAAQWRSLGEEIAHEGASRLATGVLRVSGLTAHTDIAKQAFGMEMASHVTHMRDRSFDQLDPAFAKLLQRYDIGEARWDALRAVTPEQYKGTDWTYPQTVASAGDQKLADDYMRMIVSEADYAVPVPDLRTRALINSRLEKGTWLGEIVRSTFLFKGFPITVLNMHGRRMLEQGMGGGEVAAHLAGAMMVRYGLSMLALTTLGGALSVQVKEVARGRDPLPMDDSKFWSAAGLQGGGLGIFGDFIFNSQNRFGGGVAETLVGPGAQLYDNALAATAGGVMAQMDEDEGNDDAWRKATAKIVMSETPGLSLWYTRLAVERTFGDMVSEWAYGEDIGTRRRRLEQYAAERGTQSFAPSGAGFDWRAPNWSNALGEEADEVADQGELAAAVP